MWGWGVYGTYLPQARRQNEVHGHAPVLVKPLAIGHRAHELSNELLTVDVVGYRHDELKLVMLCVMSCSAVGMGGGLE